MLIYEKLNELGPGPFKNTLYVSFFIKLKNFIHSIYLLTTLEKDSIDFTGR